MDDLHCNLDLTLSNHFNKQHHPAIRPKVDDQSRFNLQELDIKSMTFFLC